MWPSGPHTPTQGQRGQREAEKPVNGVRSAVASAERTKREKQLLKGGGGKKVHCALAHREGNKIKGEG